MEWRMLRREWRRGGDDFECWMERNGRGEFTAEARRSQRVAELGLMEILLAGADF
jgi:hypothetical protein